MMEQGEKKNTVAIVTDEDVKVRAVLKKRAEYILYMLVFPKENSRVFNKKNRRTGTDV